jgi:hypothetical protein
MTTFVKHVALLALLFALIPMVARLLSNRVNRRVGSAPIGLDPAFLVQCILLGITFSLAANGAWEFFTLVGISPSLARFLSLSAVGVLYGWFFGLQDYMYKWPSIALGMCGGLLTALLYAFLPYNPATLALFAATMTIFPLLAIEFPQGPIGRLVTAGQSFIPLRGYVR